MTIAAAHRKLKEQRALRNSDPESDKPLLCPNCGAEFKASDRKKYAKAGAWEETYFSLLRQAYSYNSAAAKSGINPSTVYKRRQYDQEFAEQEAIAYHEGTHWYETQAQHRITDKDKPGDRVLNHMLGYRGITPKQQIELSGSVGVQHSLLPVDKLPLTLCRMIQAVLSGTWDLSPELESEILAQLPAPEVKLISSQSGSRSESGIGDEQ